LDKSDSQVIAAPFSSEDKTETTGPSSKALSRQLMDMVLQQESRSWDRSKIMIVGEGRAGKTALANNIIGKPFQETVSTIGINQFTCDVKFARTGDGAWSEHTTPDKNYEAAIAALMREKRKDHSVSASKQALGATNKPIT
jgi:septin family protein